MLFYQLLNKDQQQILDYINRTTKVDSKTNCHNWQGTKNKHGYGRCSKLRYVFGTAFMHRISYLLNKGEFDSNLDICHSCNNRSCINPEHLSPGTHQENMLYKTLSGGAKKKLLPAQVSQIFELNQKGLTNIEIAKAFNVTDSSISMVLSGKRWKYFESAFKGKTKNNNYFNEEEIIDIFKSYKELNSLSKVAKKFNTVPSVIYNILKRIKYTNVVIPDKYLISVKKAVKLLPEQVVEIYQSKNKKSAKELANNYNIHKDTVRLIWNKKIWNQILSTL